MKKRALSLLLSMLLVLAILTPTALARDEISATSDLTEAELDLIYDEANYENEFVPGQVIIGLNADSRITARTLEAKVNEDLAVDEIKDLFENVDTERETYLVTLEEETEQAVLDAIEALKDDPNVAYAEPNYIVFLDEPEPVSERSVSSASAGVTQVPNDPYYSLQYGLRNIDAPAAWDITTGDPSVLVGVVDSGADLDHPDLNISRELAYDPIYGGDAYDSTGHGTHVSGIIGAIGNNGIGVTGVCWDVIIVPIQIRSARYGPNGADYMVDSLNYATEQNIPLLNMSLNLGVYSQATKDAIDTYPGLAVCAAGNESANNDTTPYYPASYECDNIIVVASTTEDDTLSTFSSYGSKTVHLGAPGSDIYSTALGGGYEYHSGTSMATPFVTGAAALLMSYCVENNIPYTTQDIKDAILAGVDVIPALEGMVATGGRLNVKNALDELIEALGEPDPSGFGSLTISKTVAGDLNEDDFGAEEFQFTVTGPDNYAEEVWLPVEGSRGVEWSYTLTGLPAGTYTVTETSAADRSGYSLATTGERSIAVYGDRTSDIAITNTYTSQGVLPNTVTYNYRENGGTSSTAPDSVQVAQGAPVDLTYTATKSGWTFAGWNTNKDATTGLSALDMGSSDITLYAIYHRTLTGTFNDYGGARTASVTIYNNAAGGAVTVPAVSSYSGWTGRGWSTSTAPNAATQVVSGSYSISADTAFYGLYQRTLTLSYDAGGDVNTPSSQTGTQYVNSYLFTNTYDPSLTLASAANLTPPGPEYVFDGWLDEGSGEKYSPGSTISIAGNTTLVATWTDEPADIWH